MPIPNKNWSNYTRDGTWLLWVSLLASEEESQGYEVTMSTEGTKGASIKVTGQVYSVDLGGRSVLDDSEGVLELSKSMIKKLGRIEEGKFKIEINYEILKKWLKSNT